MTIHKSQGKQFKRVIINIPGNFSSFITKNLLYTAVSRTKDYCLLFSNDNVINRAVRNEIKNYNTMLQMQNQII